MYSRNRTYWEKNVDWVTATRGLLVQGREHDQLKQDMWRPGCGHGRERRDSRGLRKWTRAVEETHTGAEDMDTRSGREPGGWHYSGWLACPLWWHSGSGRGGPRGDASIQLPRWWWWWWCLTEAPTHHPVPPGITVGYVE